MDKYAVVIPAAGLGKRMGLGFNKLLYELNNKSIILHTLDIFINDVNCNEIILVINNEDENTIKESIYNYNNISKIKLTYGGNERRDSVYNGLQLVESEIVLIHDGARPFIEQQLIHDLVKEVNSNDLAILAVPTKDTIKIVKDMEIESTPPRKYIYNAQTPQGFKTNILKQCYQQAINDNYMATDDAEVCERYYNKKVKIVNGSYSNIKITSIEDIVIAKEILKLKS